MELASCLSIKEIAFAYKAFYKMKIDKLNAIWGLFIAKLEKKIANDILDHETNIEGEVTKRLNGILETNLSSIQKHKRNVTKLTQENESAKNKLRLNDNNAKTSQLAEDVAECETKLDKERDIWAAEMFELIAEEETIASCIINYVKYQQLCYKSALSEIEQVLGDVNGFISKFFNFFKCAKNVSFSTAFKC